MRHEATALVTMVLLLAAAAGCSRLTFVRPASKVEKYEAATRSYNVKDSEQTRHRMAARERLQLATQRLQSGDLDAAERETRRLLKEDPSSAGAYTLLAVIEQNRGRQTEAGAHYRHAAELSPKDGGALNNYGTWLCANGYPAESLVWFDRALGTPGYATPAAALANAGACAMKTGQYERAGRDLRRALDLAPDNVVALGAMAEHEYRQGRYLQARAFTERRIAAAPATAEVLQIAVNVENALGDKAAANRYLQRLRTEFPDAADPTTALGRAKQP